MENYADIKAQLKALNEDISLIKNALIGNPQFKQKGMVDDVQEHAKYIEEDKRLKNRLAGGMAIGIPVTAGIWAVIVEWIKSKF